MKRTIVRAFTLAVILLWAVAWVLAIAGALYAVYGKFRPW